MALLISFAEQWESYGWPGLALFGLSLFVASFCFVPRTLFCLVGGFLFGWASLPIIWLFGGAAMVIGVWFSGTLFRPFVMRRAGRRMHAAINAIDDNGALLIGLISFAGPFPGTAQMMIYGLSKKPVLFVSLIATIAQSPQIILFIALGALGRFSTTEGLSSLRLSLALLTILTTCAIILIVASCVKDALSALQKGS